MLLLLYEVTVCLNVFCKTNLISGDEAKDWRVDPVVGGQEGEAEGDGEHAAEEDRRGGEGREDPQQQGEEGHLHREAEGGQPRLWQEGNEVEVEIEVEVEEKKVILFFKLNFIKNLSIFTFLKIF